MSEVLDTFALDWLRDFSVREGIDPRASAACDWIVSSDRLVVGDGDDRRDAEDGYRKALNLFETLAVADPANKEWQRGRSISLSRIGDMERVSGNLTAALTNYRASFAITERLVATDPTNTEWRRNLSVSHNKIGDIQHRLGDLAAALTSYQTGFMIRERLAKDDPANADWQRDVAVSHNRIGDMRADLGDLGAALISYQAGFAITERLAKSDPGNADGKTLLRSRTTGSVTCNTAWGTGRPR